MFYVTDEKEQSQYINMFKEEGIDAVILPHNIDSPFISQLEQKNENVKFLRIDAELTDTFKAETAEDEAETLKADGEKLKEIFKKALGDDKLEVKLEKLKTENMYNLYGMDPSLLGGAGLVLVLNAGNHLVHYVLNHGEDGNTAKICEQLYDLALLSHGSLSPERMTKFIARTNEIMSMIAGE